jgi:hypothetical protein
MELACRLYHGERRDAPSEVLAYPHLELLSTDEKERWKLKVVADQLREFGCVPYSYKEVQSADGSVTSSRLVVALYERQDVAPTGSTVGGATQDRR